jgi:hypothetical protein
MAYTVAEFINPDWRDKVNSGIGLSYRPARLHGLRGRYNNPMPELTLYLSQGSINSATVLSVLLYITEDPETLASEMEFA